jgi:hypothetical protein
VLKLLVWVKIDFVKSGLNGEISPNLVTLPSTSISSIASGAIKFYRRLLIPYRNKLMRLSLLVTSTQV